MKISRRAGIDLMPRTNHRVITTVLYAAELRSVVVWFNRGLWAIARGICHAPGAKSRSALPVASRILASMLQFVDRYNDQRTLTTDRIGLQVTGYRLQGHSRINMATISDQRTTNNEQRHKLGYR